MLEDMVLLLVVSILTAASLFADRDVFFIE